MKGKNTNLQNSNEQNTKAINDFFSRYQGDTKQEISKFLFRMQGAYFSEVDQDIDTSTEHKQDYAYRFEMLYNLVNELQPVK